jgi:hypothetical protein
MTIGFVLIILQNYKKKRKIPIFIDNNFYKNKKMKITKEVIRQLIKESYEEMAAQEDVKVSESIFDSKPGETVILNFEGVTVKMERQLDDLFKIVDAAESEKLKDGDYVKIQGNDSLVPGKSFKFLIYRETPLKYETNPLESWKIIKN